MDDDFNNAWLKHVAEEAQWQGRVDAKLESIERALLGNGTPGLASKVESLEKSRAKVHGAIAVVTVLWGFLTWLFRYHK